MKRITILFFVMLLSVATAFAQISAFDLKKGDVFEVNTAMKTNIEQEAMGQTMNVGQGVNTTELLEVTDVSNGLFTMKATVMKVRIDIELPMQPAQSMDSEGEDQMSDVAKAFTQKGYTFTINKFGEIQSVDGLEEMSAAIIADLNKTMIGQAGQSETIAQLMSEEMIKNNLANMFTIYPTDGSKEWTFEREGVFNALPAMLTADRYYDGDATIMSAGKMFVNGSQQQMGMTIQAEMSGTVNTIYDLAQNGMPTKVQVQQEATGKASAQGMEIPMVVKVNSTINIMKK